MSTPIITEFNDPAVVPSSVTFTDADLVLFSQASGDRNPLHLSRDYARLTSYGQPIVFGCLGGLACLSNIVVAADWQVTSITADFFRPMIVGVTYQIGAPSFEVSGAGAKWQVFLFDGTVPMVSVALEAQPLRPTEPTAPPQAAHSATERALARPVAEIVPGLAVSGRYANDPEALHELSERWGSSLFLASLFCWASYLVGMELPGEHALFSKLALKLSRNVRPYPEIEYRAQVCKFDARFNKAHIQVSLSDTDGAIALGHCFSYVRPSLDLGSAGKAIHAAAAARPDALAGHSAVLIGASRGLGLALRDALSARGADVFSLSRTASERLSDIAGDACDPGAIERVRQRICSTSRSLNILICNAFPSIVPLRLEPNACGRLAAYITQALAMTLTPMCGLLDLLDRSDGCLVLISSTVVDAPVQEWPHYAAAKAMAEMLARTAPLHYPRIRTVIVRPNKLLTGFTNTPVNRFGAVCPEDFAQRLANRLETVSEIPQGETEIFV